MKMILKYILVFVLFIYAIILFFPKTNLYYLGLEKLNNYQVNLITKDISDNYYSFSLDALDVKYQGINVASIDNLKISTFLFYTTIDITNLKVKKSLKKFLPYDMKAIQIRYSILNPMIVEINLSKQFNIRDKQILKYLTKTPNGYNYELKTIFN